MTQLWVTLSLADDDESEVFAKGAPALFGFAPTRKDGRQWLFQTLSCHVQEGGQGKVEFDAA
jgi:hypothetical protein